MARRKGVSGAYSHFIAKLKPNIMKPNSTQDIRREEQNRLRAERRKRRSEVKARILAGHSRPDAPSLLRTRVPNRAEKKRKRNQKKRQKERKRSLQSQPNSLQQSPNQVQILPMPDENRMASENVFNTTELAEIIFLNLSMGDLLCNVLRTCRRWNSIVKHSTMLQQHLFFKPIPMAPLRFSTKLNGWASTDDAAKRHLVFEHPLLTKLNDLAVELHIDSSLKGEESEGTTQIMGVAKQSALHTIHWKKASWRRALATQPPIADIFYENKGKPDISTHSQTGLKLSGFIYRVRTKRREDFMFNKPALRIRGFGSMAHYKGYAQLEKLVQAEKAKRSSG